MSVTPRIYDGSMYDKPIPRCGDCGETSEDLVGIERADLPACPHCGVVDQWGYLFRIRLTGEVAPTGDLTQTIFPATAVAKVTTVGQTITVEDLSTEVISKALEIGINLLPPTEGQWPIEVTGYGVVGYAGVGDRSDGLLNAMAWIEELSDRWEQQLQADET